MGQCLSMVRIGVFSTLGQWTYGITLCPLSAISAQISGFVFQMLHRHFLGYCHYAHKKDNLIDTFLNLLAGSLGPP